MKQFQSQEVAEILSISTATLRAHSKALENAGYEFKKNANKQRQYSDHDVDVLRAMLALKNEHNLSLKEAIDQVTCADFAPSSVLHPIAERQDESPSALDAQPFKGELSAILEMLTDEMVALKGENQALSEQVSALERKQDETLKAISASVSATEEIAKLSEQIEKMEQSSSTKNIQTQLTALMTAQAKRNPDVNALMSEIRKLTNKIHELESAASEPANKGFWARLFGK